MIKKLTLRTIAPIIEDLKKEAWESGRLGTYGEGKRHKDFSVKAFDNRNKSLAFRCMGYNRLVRQINALQDLINTVKELRKECEKYEQM